MPAQQDSRTRIEGFVSLLDGMQGGVDPILIKETSYSRGVNVSSRGGLIHTRPAFVKEGVSLPVGVFQGAGLWSLNSGDRFVLVVSGKLYSLTVETLQLTDHGLLFNASAQCFFCQADRFMVVQDGVSTPQILEEVGGVAQLYAYTYDVGAGKVNPEVDPNDPDPAVAATYGVPPANRIPIGTTMSFAHGRLHVVTASSRMYFVSGDVLLPDYPANCLVFTETLYWNEGGAHSLPSEMGYIYGMATIRNANTGTGVGSLIVAARRGLSAFDVGVPRSQWKDVNLAQVLFFDAGTLSPWSFVTVNDDLAYRSQDGLRFMRYSKSQVGAGSGALSNLPQSSDVSVYLDDSSAQLPYVSVAAADNRLFVTCSGTASRFFRGLVVLDFAQIAGFQGAESPSFDGVWTGLTVGQVLAAERLGKRLLFVFTQTPSLYRLDPDVTSDYNGTAFKRIVSRIETRAFPFNSADAKRLKYFELELADLVDTVALRVYFRPVGYPLWALAGEKVVSIEAGGLPQRRRRVRISVDQPSAFCDSATGEPLSTASEFQFAVEWEGFVRVVKFRAVAEVLDEGAPACESSEAPAISASVSSGVVLDDFEYSVEE